MKGKKHTPEQIIKKLREADAILASGKTIGEVCQQLVIGEQTFHRWWNPILFGTTMLRCREGGREKQTRLAR